MVYTVILTGGIGSGKSTVANVFMQFGINIIDSDDIAHQVVNPGTFAFKSIVNHFGNIIVDDNGALNRRMLREYIFSYPDERIWLNTLLHPIIYQQSQLQIAQANSSYVLWVVPLAVENKLHKKADRVLVIDIIPEIQIHRIITRDNISYNQIKQILAVQATREERLVIADDVIDNNGTQDMITYNVAQIHTKYLKLALQSRNLYHKTNYNNILRER